MVARESPEDQLVVIRKNPARPVAGEPRGPSKNYYNEECEQSEDELLHSPALRLHGLQHAALHEQGHRG